MISLYEKATIFSAFTLTWITKSPGLMPEFLAWPGCFGPPSTNRTTRAPYLGSSATGSSCNPTGPGTNVTVFSCLDPLSLADGTVFFLLLLAEEFGVRLTRTTFFVVELRDCGVLTIFEDKLVPNFRLDDFGG